MILSLCGFQVCGGGCRVKREKAFAVGKVIMLFALDVVNTTPVHAGDLGIARPEREQHAVFQLWVFNRIVTQPYAALVAQ